MNHCWMVAAALAFAAGAAWAGDGLDGTVDSATTVRRHFPMRMGGETASTRLVGRSGWNDRWLLVIPAGSLSSDRAAKGLCIREESDAFCAQTAAALSSWLAAQLSSGTILPAKRRALPW